MTMEELLVQHVLNTTYDAIPENAIDAARREVLWALGTSVAGAAAEGSDRVAAFVRQQGGPEEATLIGIGGRYPAALAGLGNGVFAKALEYEDKFWMDEAHGFGIGAAVVPAAFAVAEKLGRVDGKTLLTAVVLATDIQARLYLGAPKSLDTGWNATYVFAVFGAAMAAAKLMKLNEEQCRNALGLAYTQMVGNRQSSVEGVFSIRMQLGFGVRNGINAAELAQQGIGGPQFPLTGKFGMYSLIFKEPEIDLDAPTRDLGRAFQGTRLGFKAYPCGAVVHPVLDAVNSLLARDGINAETIVAIKVFGTPRLKRMVEPKEVCNYPKNHVETLFSLPWAIACLIVDRKLTLSHFRTEAVHDRRYAEIARIVETQMETGRRGVRVEVRLKDGRVVKSPRVMGAKGHPDNPQSTEELIEAYRDCVQHGPKHFARDNTERAKDMILNLQTVGDATEIIRLLA